MGVSTKAYINPRYGIREVKTLVETIGGTDIKVDLHDCGGFVHFTYGPDKEERQMHVYREQGSGCPLPCTSLSVNAWGSATEIMDKICNIVGGFVIPSDCDDKGYMVSDPHAGNAEFILRHQILTQGLTYRDTEKLSDAVAKATGYKR